MRKKALKFTAHVLFLTLSYQLIFPVYAFALTTGPSTPEVESFEPVGTTEMVDMFTGDFNYNIPLMDVEGYPINIAYHSGINIEQEASWVGLGWNINPGEINRTVRGLPDDFNGELIDKELNIEEERNYKVDLGVDAGLEVFGFDAEKYGFDVKFGVGGYVNFNNYRGISVGVQTSATFTTPVVSTGINVGIGSQTGADVDFNAGFHSDAASMNEYRAGWSISAGTGFNSRSGLKNLCFNIGGVLGSSDNNRGTRFNSAVPIGLQNYVPVVANQSTLTSMQFQVRLGGEIFYVFPNFYVSFFMSKLKYNSDGSRKGYGYLYSENASEESILDFSRDKDGVYNSTVPNLPLASMTYDVYSVIGQGTGGTFRPYRNDIGSVYDPSTVSVSNSDDYMIEAGFGNLFEIGSDINTYDNETRSGPWKRMTFSKNNGVGNLYEKVFFKQAGELTYNEQQNTTNIFNPEPIYLKEDLGVLYGKGGSAKGAMPSKTQGAYAYSNGSDRTTRANLLTTLTAEEASIPEVGQSSKIKACEKFGSGSANTRFYDPTMLEYDRFGVDPGKPKSYHVGEMTQTTPDGRRYVYGVPAMNNMTREVIFNVNSANADINAGLVSYTKGSTDTKQNGEGREKYYASTGTPAYAYSYLLSSVLSSDYADFTGDGPTDDDAGSYTKFHYTLWDDDYRWKAPYNENTAQYIPGYASDKKDDKGSYIIGSKQVWHLRAVESKHFIAEFYVSEREDGRGVKEAVLHNDSKLKTGNNYKDQKSTESASYKLDSIKLYNKQDRYKNEENAVPIKTVIFKYTDELCKNVPNWKDQETGRGKLTLEKIFVRYGNSDKNLLSPYVFSYHSNNPDYNFANKDRWGNYKPSDPALTNFEYPYSNQDPNNNDVAAWNLVGIKLPSGGKINVQYESDDYSFVQDRRSMQMMKIDGFGSSSEYKPSLGRLYEDVDNVNNYLYFRRSDNENPNLSLKENYLEGSDVLYYSFNVDIANTGAYEHIKGYAKVEELGVCPNLDDYCYIKLKKERSGNSSLMHPATIYALNIGRYYLPHVLYPGFDENGNNKQVLLALIAAGKELKNMFQNPMTTFVKDKKARNVRLDKSWIRLNVAGLTKKGGGIRVKELTLDDSWQKLSGNPGTATYGKRYEYKTTDMRYGAISSGVASYEPMVGGDENPFKMPVKYTAEDKMLMPAVEFFQEEPFGEGFFPPPRGGI